MKKIKNLIGIAVILGVTGIVSTAIGAPISGMALIPSGSFTMGDTLDGEGDAIPINVYVSAFYMDTNLVSYCQWQEVYNYATNNGYIFADAGEGRATNHPVQTVDWFDCVKWSNARSQQEGLTPVYYTDASFTQVFTNGDNGTTIYAKWGAIGYRLPTEAEWEKAARGGINGQRFPWGNTISETQANYQGNTYQYSYDLGPNGYNSTFAVGQGPYTSPVGYFAPNGYGLNDMAGNLFEWCWDWYGGPYGQPTTNNPTGPSSGSARMMRGGSWDHTADYARCGSHEDSVPPGTVVNNNGFRCVLPPAVAVMITNSSAIYGENTTMGASVTSQTPVSYQWYFAPANNAGQAGAYAETFNEFVVGGVVTNGGFGYGNIPHVSFVGGGGSGALGIGTISNGTVTGITVTNAGSGYASLPSVVIDPPNGILLRQTNSTLTISNASQNSLGNYSVVVSNAIGSIASSTVNLTLLYPPSITNQPQDQIVSAYATASFNVAATGTAPLYYQWLSDGSILPGATGSTLTFPSVTPPQLGPYSVIVTNNYGSVTSSVANLYMSPYLKTPLTGVDTYWGQTNVLSVLAWGSGDLAYQWYLNGAVIPDATSSNLVLSGIQFTNAGLYSVVVSSSYGSVTNTPEQVVVNPASVSIGFFAGVIIQGTVGYNYSIQGSTDLSDPNSWVTFTNITLTAPVQIWSDYSVDVHTGPQKFYRVLPGH